MAARSAVRRVVAASGIVVAVVAGLLVHTQLPDTDATDIAGDALYAAAVYLAVVFVAARLRPVFVGAIAAGWCVAVELLQLTGLPAQWGGEFALVTLVLGTVFDARDLAVYVVTAAVFVVGDVLLSRGWSRRRSVGDGSA